MTMVRRHREFADASDLEREARELRAKLEQAEENNRQLRAELLGAEFTPPVAWRLTGRHVTILRLLCARPLVTFETYCLAVQSGADDYEADPKVLQVHLCHLRRKLARFEVAIETRWGQGYWLTPEMRRKVLDACRAGREPDSTLPPAPEAEAEPAPAPRRAPEHARKTTHGVRDALRIAPGSTVAEISRSTRLSAGAVQGALYGMLERGEAWRMLGEPKRPACQPPFLYWLQAADTPVEDEDG